MENLSIWCWFIPAVVGIVCALFGYLIGKGKNSQIDHTSELNLLKDKNAKLETDLAACNKQLSQKVELVVPAKPVAPIAAAEALLPFNAQAAKAALGKTVKRDDLKIVEGIGPKIAETLAAAGISTFAELAKADASKISEIIADVRGNHVTDTWPAQAKLAADGKWDELKKWQDELDGGKA